MSRSGDVHENRLTGERSVILHGTDDGPEQRIVAHVTVPTRVAVIGEHLHPSIHERLLVVSGRMGLRGPREPPRPRPGGRPAARRRARLVERRRRRIVEVDPADRFELMISTLFGLASDGKTNAKGIPNLLQLAVIAREFDDIVRFVKPPRLVQRTLFGVLAPIGRALGYLPVYGAYVRPDARVTPDPEIIARAGLSPASGA